MFNQLHRNFKFFSNFGYQKPIYANYSYNWINDVNPASLLTKIKPRHRAKCDFPPANKKLSDSTSDDLIIGCSLRSTHGLKNFIGTFKATKSKASLVIIIDDQALEDAKKMGLLEEAHFINVKTFPGIKNWERFQFKMPQFELLSTFGSYFKRVIITDVSDVVFQGDPFQKDQDWSKICFTWEVASMNHNPCLVSWDQHIPNWKPVNDLNAEELNSGIILGTGKKLEELSRIMIEMLMHPVSMPYLNDQSILQWLRMNEFLDDCGIETETRGRNKLAYFPIAGRFFDLPFPNACVPFADDYASFVHKFDLYAKEYLVYVHCMVSWR